MLLLCFDGGCRDESYSKRFFWRVPERPGVVGKVQRDWPLEIQHHHGQCCRN